VCDSKQFRSDRKPRARREHAPGSRGSLLAFWYFDALQKRWHGPSNLVSDDHAPIEVTGNPALIQSSFGRQGNFELVVPQGDRLRHYWRDNDRPERPWRRGAALTGFGANIPGLRSVPVGVSMFQSNLGGAGNLEILARFQGQSGDFLASYYLDSVAKGWQGPFPVMADGAPIAGVTGNPAATRPLFRGQGISSFSFLEAIVVITTGATTTTQTGLGTTPEPCAVS